MRARRMSRITVSWRRSLVAAAIAAALLVMSVVAGEKILAVAAYSVALFAVIPTAAYFLNVGRRREDVAVTIDAAGVRLGDVLLDATTVRAGRATATPRGTWRVDLVWRLRPIVELEVDTAEDARTILAALGLDRREGTTHFRVRAHPAGPGIALYGSIILGVMAVCLLGLSLVAAFAFLAGAAIVPILDRWLWTVDFTIGVDAIAFRTGAMRKVLPHARIRRVFRLDPPFGQVVSPGFVIVADDGQSFAFDSRSTRFRGGVWQADPVYDAVVEAWRRAVPGHAPSAASVALARGGRSVRDWFAALRGNASDAHGYRVAALHPTELFAILEDAEASAELRAAAAIALGASTGERSRLRVAADDLADPVLRRVALDASGDVVADDALAEALEEAVAADARASSAAARVSRSQKP